MIQSIKGHYKVKTYDDALTLSHEKMRLVKNCDDKIFRYIWKKKGCFDGFELDGSTLLIPCIKSSNDFLISLFCQYPNLSDKQMEWWKKITDQIYYYNETEGGRQEIKNMDDGIYWLEKIIKECKLSFYDDGFIHRFYNTAKKMRAKNRKLTDKQMVIVEKMKQKYWKQLQKRVVDKL